MQVLGDIGDFERPEWVTRGFVRGDAPRTSLRNLHGMV